MSLRETIQVLWLNLLCLDSADIGMVTILPGLDWAEESVFKANDVQPRSFVFCSSQSKWFWGISAPKLLWSDGGFHFQLEQSWPDSCLESLCYQGVPMEEQTLMHTERASWSPRLLYCFSIQMAFRLSFLQILFELLWRRWALMLWAALELFVLVVLADR